MDCRFQRSWTSIDFFDELLLSRKAYKKHHRLERKILQTADCVVAVSSYNATEFKEKGAKKVTIITNGFDEADFSPSQENVDEQFSLRHVGTFMYNRNPRVLWLALKELCIENPAFKRDLLIHLIGKTDQRIIREIAQAGLETNLLATPYLPHDEAIVALKKACVLLLLSNNTGNTKGMLTGKFFEYLAVKRPILAIAHPMVISLISFGKLMAE